MGSGQGKGGGSSGFWCVFSFASYVQISHLTSVLFIEWDSLCQMYVIKVL